MCNKNKRLFKVILIVIPVSFIFVGFVVIATQYSSPSLLLLLSNKTRSSVHNLDPEHLRALADKLAGLRTNVVVDHSSVLTVVHEEHLDVLEVAHVEALLPVRRLVLEATVSPVTDLGLGGSAFEPPAHGVIDTVGLSPASLYKQNRKKMR